jgi:methyl-accepting chemotaxis protein-1 (serine sensor receptor)
MYNLTIRARLIAVLSLLSFLLLAVGGAGLASLGKSHQTMRTVYHERLVSLGQLDNMVRLMLRNQLAITRAADLDPGALPAAIEQIEQNRNAASKLWQEYSKDFVTDEEREMAARFEAARSHFVLDAIAPALAAAKSGDIDAMRTLVDGPVQQMFPRLREEMDKLIVYQLERGKAQYQQAETNYPGLRILIMTLTAFGIVLAAGIGWWLVRAIPVSLNRALTVVQAMAKGDLSQDIEVRSDDETGKLLAALKELKTNLTGMVGDVRQATEDISLASVQVAASHHELSRRTDKQASSLQETSASLDDLSNTVRRNADRARQINQLAQDASNIATRNGAAVFQMLEKLRCASECSGSVDLQGLNTCVNDVVGAVHRVSAIVNEITSASHEQSIGIEQISTAVMQMGAATQQNAMMVEQAAAAAAAARQHATVLSMAVSLFRLAPSSALRHGSGGANTGLPLRPRRRATLILPARRPTLAA